MGAAAVSVQCECGRRQSSFHASRARRLHVHDSAGTDHEPQPAILSMYDSAMHGESVVGVREACF